MNRKLVMAGLTATLVLQVAVLAVEYIGAMYPLWTGQEVRLKTVPVDPRSMFRGNYARLQYDISRIPTKDLVVDRTLRYDEIVYVLLKPGADGVYGYAGASLVRPATGTYLRGRVQWPRWQRSGDTVQVKYGIEAFFAPKKKAMQLQLELRGGGVASIMLAANGKATLQNVLPKQAKQPER